MLVSSLRAGVIFFFNDAPPPEIYPLPLHDALPISFCCCSEPIRETGCAPAARPAIRGGQPMTQPVFLDYDQAALDRQYDQRAWATNAVTVIARYTADRKSTRLNSSHSQISYAVFCL